MKLLTKYKTVENIYSHLSELSLGIQKKLINEEDILRISYLLAELKPQLSLETLKGFPESSNFVAFASGAKEYILKLGFQSLLRRI